MCCQPRTLCDCLSFLPHSFHRSLPSGRFIFCIFWQRLPWARPWGSEPGGASAPVPPALLCLVWFLWLLERVSWERSRSLGGTLLPRQPFHEGKGLESLGRIELPEKKALTIETVSSGRGDVYRAPVSSAARGSRLLPCLPGSSNPGDCSPTLCFPLVLASSFIQQASLSCPPLSPPHRFWG